MNIRKVYHHAKHTRDYNAREHCSKWISKSQITAAEEYSYRTDSHFANIEAVDLDVNKRECLKERIVNAIYKCAVDIGEEYGWVLEHNLHRLD